MGSDLSEIIYQCKQQQLNTHDTVIVSNAVLQYL